MRLRRDSAHLAGWRRAMDLGALVRRPDGDYSAMDATPPAELGDVWIIRQAPGRYVNGSISDEERASFHIAGYGLTCPNEKCDQGMHFWDHAWDCRRPECASCWTWTGSVEGGDLTASPSLHVLAERGGCGWHGWLRNGQMVLA